ncbi:MAG: ppiB [Anaerolineaceae bacterium]|nr:MAG: ppiB [Anaerolineaceae bacterium]
MTKKHHSRHERRAARARARIFWQAAFYGVILVVAALIVWTIVAGREPAANLPPIPTAGGPTPMLVGTQQYSSAPPFLIDVDIKYFATFKMAKGGEFVIQLYPEQAPVTVNSFVFLARQGYYDGVTFHRVIDGFMAQAGDPTGTGMGDPGYKFVDEANDLVFDKAGIVAMANSGPDTNGSQFFITYDATEWLNGKHTIFGQVISGMDVVNGITRRDPSQNPTTPGDVIESITITEE